MSDSRQERIRLALWFSVTGDLRYLSHRDSLRLWHRALTRARTPVRFTQGFNPHMRMSMPLPRSVGMASQSELLLVELDRPSRPDRLKAELAEHLPDGIEITAVKDAPPHASHAPCWAKYRISLSDDVDHSRLSRRVDEFLQAEHWCVQRPKRGRHPKRNIDLRRCVTKLKLKEGSLICKIDIQPAGTARIDELLTMLELNSPSLTTKIERITIAYSPELTNIGNTDERTKS